MDENDIEGLLWDCVDQDDPDRREYQSTGITKLAELIASYERRITQLEKQLGDRA